MTMTRSSKRWPSSATVRRLRLFKRVSLFPLYTARRGEYRVIYSIIDAVLVIEIVSIVHRRDA